MKVFESPGRGIFTGMFALNSNPSEKAFKNTMSKHGFLVIDAPEYQNRKDHIDFYLNMVGVRISVDLKYTNDLYDNFVIELKGFYGEPGSTLGKADKIVFMHRNIFYFFDRKGLLDFALKYKSSHNIESMTQDNGRKEFILIDKQILIDALKPGIIENLAPLEFT